MKHLKLKTTMAMGVVTALFAVFGAAPAHADARALAVVTGQVHIDGASHGCTTGTNPVAFTGLEILGAFASSSAGSLAGVTSDFIGNVGPSPAGDPICANITNQFPNDPNIPGIINVGTITGKDLAGSGLTNSLCGHLYTGTFGQAGLVAIANFDLTWDTAATAGTCSRTTTAKSPATAVLAVAPLGTITSGAVGEDEVAGVVYGDRIGPPACADITLGLTTADGTQCL